MLGHIFSKISDAQKTRLIDTFQVLACVSPTNLEGFPDSIVKKMENCIEQDMFRRCLPLVRKALRTHVREACGAGASDTIEFALVPIANARTYLMSDCFSGPGGSHPYHVLGYGYLINIKGQEPTPYLGATVDEIVNIIIQDSDMQEVEYSKVKEMIRQTIASPYNRIDSSFPILFSTKSGLKASTLLLPGEDRYLIAPDIIETRGMENVDRKNLKTPKIIYAYPGEVYSTVFLGRRYDSEMLLSCQLA